MKVFSSGVNNTSKEVIVTQAAWPGSANQWVDLTSLSLTPGTWQLSFHFTQVNSGGDAPHTTAKAGVGTVSGNDSTGINYSTNAIALNPCVETDGNEYHLGISGYVVTITTTTTFYIKGFVDGVTNVAYYGRFTARLIV